MTSKQVFWAAYQRTAKAVNATIDPGHAEECWRQSEAFHTDLYDAAATRLLASAKFLPRPAEWREALRDLTLEADQESRRAREAVLAATDQRTYHCAVCQDTGWEMRTHPAGKCPICPKHHLSEAAWATECLCRPTNPTWQHKVDRQREMVHTPTRERRTA